MKKTNLLLVIGLSLIIGGSALNITANFNNDEIKTTQPKKTNENLTYFELIPDNLNITTANDNVSDEIFNTTLKTEWQGYNNALMFKGESISQSTYEKINGNNIFYIGNIPSTQNTILNKWQITPYKNLVNVEETTKIRIQLKLYFNGESGAPLEQTNGKIYLKITTLTSTQNWSNYMNQTNYYIKDNNNSIIQEILNPQNEQIYNKNEEIITLDINNENTIGKIDYTQDIELLTTKDNRTNYIFTYIQPYIEEINTLNYISGDNNNWGYIWNNENEAIKISGYMLPIVDNYEVIDLPGLLFNILTMPFAFISTAFNLTLFPGTPYQINLSNLFLTIMAILIFVFIVKLFINMKG